MVFVLVFDHIDITSISAGSGLSGDEIVVTLSAESSGRGVEGRVVIRGYRVVPSVAGAGSWRLRNGLKWVENDMVVLK